VTVEQLIDGLWREVPPASAVQSLQVYVHGLRRALGAGRIETAGKGYRVVVDEDELDLDRFERLLERGRAALETGHTDDAVDDLREALAVWRGRALADLPDETRRAADAERLEELRLTALELPRLSPPSIRTTNGSCSSGCSRSTAAAGKPRRSRSTATHAAPSLTS
jgi:DNA-binding SARP family transcriptional activator